MVSRDKNILAGEYVLGTLDTDERDAAEKLLVSDRAFSHCVRTWERQLSPLSEAEPEMPPPAALWRNISVKLPDTRGPLSEFADQLMKLRRGIAIWRYATVSAVAAAIALALVWVGGLQSPFHRPAPQERYVAMLQDKAGETGFVITMDMQENLFAVKPVNAKTPPSKSYELWCIMKNGKRAMTVGLVGTEAYAMMNIPTELTRKDLETGVELAVSLEPEGGAPSGRSMGPIMFAGLLIKQTP